MNTHTQPDRRRVLLLCRHCGKLWEVPLWEVSITDNATYCCGDYPHHVRVVQPELEEKS